MRHARVTILALSAALSAFATMSPTGADAGLRSVLAAASRKSGVSVFVDVRGEDGLIPAGTASLAGPVLATAPIKAGRSVFVDLPPGAYTLVVRADGYVIRTTPIVATAMIATASVVLRRDTRLRKIGTVAAPAMSRTGVNHLGDELQALSAGTADGLSKLAGVALLSSGPGTEFVSLRGHDPAQTAASVSGVPLNVPGFAANVGALDLDLLDDAEVDLSAATGGGTVSFRTVNPTPLVQASVEGTYGSYDRSSIRAVLQGTAGKTGFAASYGRRDDVSPLAGQTYLDASGFTYRHAGDNIQEGLSLITSASVGLGRLHATVIRSRNDADVVCATWLGSVPCGYGPHNSSGGSFALTSIGVSGAIRSAAVDAAAYSVDSKNYQDLSRGFFANIPLATSSFAATGLRGVTANLDIPSAFGRFQISANSGAISTDAESATSGAHSAFSRSTHFFTSRIDDTFKSTSKVQADVAVSTAQISGLQSTGTLSAQGRFKAGIGFAWVGAATGSQPTSDGTTTPLTPPGALQFDCTDSVAFGTAPGAVRSVSSSTGASLGYALSIPAGKVAISTFEETQHNASLVALLDQTQIGLPSQGGYGSAVAAGASALCGRSMMPPVYFAALMGGLNVRYRGIQADATLHAGPRARNDLHLVVLKSNVWPPSGVSQDPLSILKPGKPIPGIPTMSAYDSLAYAASASTDLFAGLRFVGSNNSQFLPPSVTLDLAFRTRLSYGQVSLLLSNVLESHAGIFRRFTTSPGYVANIGADVPALQVPNLPRRLQLSYSAAVGRDVVAHDHLLAHIADDSDVSDVILRGTLVSRWPITKPRAPLRMNSDAQCSRDDASIQQSINALVRQAMSDRRAIATNGWTSLTSAANVELAEGFFGTRVLRMTTRSVSVLNAITHCALLHLGRPEDALAAHLPYEPTPAVTSLTIFYADKVGFYFVDIPKPDEIATAIRYYELPNDPPSDPFALNEAACPPSLRPVADRFLHELRAIILGGDTPVKSALRVVPHSGATATWDEVLSDDIGVVSAVVACAHVSIATPAELTVRGLGTGGPNAINYAPEVGIYVSKGQSR